MRGVVGSVAEAKEEGAHYEKHFTNFDIGNIIQPCLFLYGLFGGASQGAVNHARRSDVFRSRDQRREGPTLVDLEADEYYFEPALLRGTPGQKLKLEIENESGTRHNFSIPEQSLDMDIPPKGKVVVELTFPQSGLVSFC